MIFWYKNIICILRILYSPLLSVCWTESSVCRSMVTAAEPLRRGGYWAEQATNAPRHDPAGDWPAARRFLEVTTLPAAAADRQVISEHCPTEMGETPRHFSHLMRVVSVERGNEYGEIYEYEIRVVNKRSKYSDSV